MSTQVEITITPDRYHISLNRNNSISTRLFCSILRELGIAGLKCDDRYTTLEAIYDDILKNGEVVFVCTRRGDLGASVHTAFGLFFFCVHGYL